MRRSLRISIGLIAGVLAMAPSVQAQVTGTVTSAESGEPLATVQVSIEGTGIGGLTNEEGRYLLINVPAGPQVVLFQYLGFETERREITVTEGEAVVQDVTLAGTVLGLDELVVVGYGTQLRREVTGAVTSVPGIEIAQASVTPNLQTALQGRLAGVNVAESSGEPGAAPQVLVRGRGSISAGTEPLYVIDGVPYSMNLAIEGDVSLQRASFGGTRANPLANLNPNDIETIEVLKDAAAAAIYGSRGSNGVILITTKRGQRGAPAQVSFRAYGGLQTAFHRPRLMTAAENIDYVKAARNNAYEQGRDPTNPASPNYNPLYNPDNNAGRSENGASGSQLIPEAYVNWDGTDSDWIGAILDDAVLQNYDASIRGGSDNLAYFVSGSYMDQSGVIKGSSFQRLALRANLTLDPTDRLQLNVDVNSAYADHDRKAANAPYFGRPPGLIYSAMVSSPLARIYDSDGNYLQRGENSINALGSGMTSTNHALAARDYIDDKMQTGRVFGSVSADLDLRDDLRYRALFGYDYDTRNRHFYQGTRLQYRGRNVPDPYAQALSGASRNWLLENTLNWNGSSGAHSFNVLAGYTAERQFDDTQDVIARNFPDDQVRTINGGEITGGDQVQSEWSLVSALGRVNYTLLNRYLATATFRSDRSSRFGWGNQTGYFPSLSLGWQVTEEPFMRGSTLFSQLKPRVSYGVTGNFQIPNYGSIGLVGRQPYVLGDAVVAGATPRTLGNRELTWETTRQLNVGVDFGIMADRIYGAFDYYVSNTEDLLLNVNVPSSTGFATVLTNVGEVRNTGFEAQITSRNLVGGFQWSTDLSLGMNTNEVVRLGPEGDPILAAGVAGVRHITQVGGEIGAYYGYVHDGIYQSEADIASSPTDSRNVTPGDIRWKDVNGDGRITADDRTELGSYNPDMTWGLFNRFAVGSVELSVFFQGVVGREVLNLTRRHLTAQGNFNGYGNLVGNYWTPENPGNGWDHKPDRQDHGGNTRPSNYQMEDGSYTSFKSITLSWNVPPDLVGGIFGQAPGSVRVFGAVNNVHIWTDYWGWNPEASVQSTGLTPGQDYGAYPLMRAFQFGAEIGF